MFCKQCAVHTVGEGRNKGRVNKKEYTQMHNCKTGVGMEDKGRNEDEDSKERQEAEGKFRRGWGN